MLVIQKWRRPEPNEETAMILTHKSVGEMIFDTFRLPIEPGRGLRPHLGFSSTLLVNLMDIVLTIEELTGEKLKESTKN